MKNQSCIRWSITALLFIATISCEQEPLPYQGGVDCGGCADVPPGGGTLAQGPSINSFNPVSGYTPFPNTGIPGTLVSISGLNFSSSLTGNMVRFNGSPAVVTFASASLIKTSVPAGATTGRITVTVNNMTATSSTDFTVLTQNVWEQVANFGGIGRYGTVSFVIKNRAYVGTGHGITYPKTGVEVEPMKDFWEYNPANDTWTQKADFGGAARGFATGFATGSRGYIGIGGGASAYSDFWEYNPSTNTWIQKANFPGENRYFATGFTINPASGATSNAKGYIATGAKSNGHRLRDFWEYDPATDQWTRKKDFGGVERAFAGSFVINGRGYVGAGRQVNNATPDFWEYDPVNNSWIEKASLGSNSTGDHSGFFSIGSKGYAGGGAQNQLWMFDPIANTWVQKADLPTNLGTMDLGTGFAIGNYGYIGLGNYTYGGLHHLAFYRYTPD